MTYIKNRWFKEEFKGIIFYVFYERVITIFFVAYYAFMTFKYCHKSITVEVAQEVLIDDRVKKIEQ